MPPKTFSSVFWEANASANAADAQAGQRGGQVDAERRQPRQAAMSNARPSASAAEDVDDCARPGVVGLQPVAHPLGQKVDRPPEPPDDAASSRMVTVRE